MQVAKIGLGRFVSGFLIASALLAGCAGGDTEEVAGPVDELRGGPPPGSVAIPFQVVEDDVGDRAAREVRVLIRSKQGYLDYFGHAPPATIDFGREWVIFYGAGVKPTGGYAASVLSLSRSGKDFLAVTQLVSPGAGCAVTDALTTPHTLIKFSAQHGAAVTFKRSDETRACDPPENPCATVLCPPKTRCELREVICVRAPCPPIAECVPIPTDEVFCGGIAGIPCPGAGMCVDNPSDDCDPDRGGADCGGICTCSGAAVSCGPDTVFDPSPAVCACVPQTGPTCGKVTCAAGQFCCNASCGICALPGRACIQIACE